MTYGMNKLSLLALMTSLLALPAHAPAATGTWTGGGAGTWDTTATNWSGVAGTPWDAANGPSNTALFTGAGDVANTSGVLTASRIDIGDTGFSASATLNGGPGIVTANNGVYVGSLSANNTLNVSGIVRITAPLGNSRLNIGDSTFGGNSVVLSTPATSGSPTFGIAGSSNQVNIGVSSSNNSLTVQNGAYLRVTGGGGTNTWTLGTNAGANNNSILVTGTGSTIDRGGAGGSSINVGAAGDGNSMTIIAGGTVIPRRLGIGTNGGDNNFIHVTGASSFLSGNDSQPILEIGRNGGTGNYMRIDSGATATFDSSQNRGYMVGPVNGSNNNYILVDGAGSTFTMRQGMPLAIGGIAGQNNNNHIIIDSTANGNHFDIYGGAKSFQNTVYLLGVNSAVNLGNGSVAVSELEVKQSTGSGIYGLGVQLSKSDSMLNIDRGRLIAGLFGDLVTGPGQVVLNGDAYVSTPFTNTISSQITGSGDLFKEGAGELQLTSPLNNYTGDTSVLAGILEIQNPFLADAADVLLTTGGVFDLNFLGTDTINALFFNNVAQAAGTWGATGSGATFINDTFFSGTGVLNVGGGGGGSIVPEPSAFLLLGTGLLGLLAYRRRRRRR